MSSIAVQRLRARRLRRMLLLLAVLVVAVIGASLLPQGQHAGAYRVPTSDRAGSGTPTGVVQGPLRAARSGGTVCFTVAASQGRVLLVSPPGWSADRSLRLLDAGGQTRATDGATMAFLGTPGATGALPGCSGTGRLWYVDDVRLPSQRG
ncbi:MAG: hypothetical protein ACTHJL_05695 [Amnibacterium sp.]